MIPRSASLGCGLSKEKKKIICSTAPERDEDAMALGGAGLGEDGLSSGMGSEGGWVEWDKAGYPRAQVSGCIIQGRGNETIILNCSG